MRAQKQPRDPLSLQDLEFPHEWTLAMGENPVKFVQFDSGKSSKDRMVIDRIHVVHGLELFHGPQVFFPSVRCKENAVKRAIYEVSSCADHR